MQAALVQLASTTDPADNRRVIDATLGTLDRGVHDLVVLPEAAMCDFGQPGEALADRAETLDGPFVRLITEHARRLDATVVAGMFEATDGLPFNTLVAVSAGGDLLAAYRKIHLYDSFGYRESERLLPGELTPAVIDVAGTRVGLMTCYDLRFPELARALVDDDAEVILVPSAWVRGPLKEHQWSTLVAARAIENTVAVLAVGHCGDNYIGHTLAVDATGSVLARAGVEPEVISVRIDPGDIAAVRTSNPSLLNRRMPPQRTAAR